MSDSFRGLEMGSDAEAGGVVSFHTPEQRIRYLLKRNQQIRTGMRLLPVESDRMRSALQEIEKNNKTIESLRNEVSTSVRQTV